MAPLLRQIALLLLIAAAPTVVSGLWHPRRSAWSAPAPFGGEVILATALAWEPDVLWIDARSRDAYAVAHHPGALWLSEDAWDEGFERVSAAWSPGVKVVVYCDSASCDTSHTVAQRLRDEAAFEHVYALHGGWEILRSRSE